MNQTDNNLRKTTASSIFNGFNTLSVPESNQRSDPRQDGFPLGGLQNRLIKGLIDAEAIDPVSLRIIKEINVDVIPLDTIQEIAINQFATAEMQFTFDQKTCSFEIKDLLLYLHQLGQVQTESMDIIGGFLRRLICLSLEWCKDLFKHYGSEEVAKSITEELLRSVEAPFSDVDVRFKLCSPEIAHISNFSHNIIVFLKDKLQIPHSYQELARQETGFLRKYHKTHLPEKRTIYTIASLGDFFLKEHSSDPLILECLFPMKLPRQSLCVHDSLCLDIKSLITNQSPSLILKSSGPSGLFQALTDMFTKVIHIDNPETADAAGFIRILSLLSSGWVFGENEKVFALLCRTFFTPEPLVEEIKSRVEKCLDNHHNKDPAARIFLLYHLSAALKDRKESPLIEKLWMAEKCEDESHSLLNKISQALCKSNLPFEVVNAVIGLAAFQTLSRISVKDKEAKIALKWHKQNYSLQIRIAEGSCSYLLIPFEPAKWLEILQVYSFRENKSALLAADIFHAIRKMESPEVLDEESLFFIHQPHFNEIYERLFAHTVELKSLPDTFAFYIESCILLTLKNYIKNKRWLTDYFPFIASSKFSKGYRKELLEEFLRALNSFGNHSLCTLLEKEKKALGTDNDQKWIYSWVKSMAASQEKELLTSAAGFFQHSYERLEEKQKIPFLHYFLSLLFPGGISEANRLLRWAQKQKVFHIVKDEQKAILIVMENTDYSTTENRVYIPQMIKILRAFLSGNSLEKMAAFKTKVLSFIKLLSEERFLFDAREILEKLFSLKLVDASEVPSHLLALLEKYIEEGDCENAAIYWSRLIEHCQIGREVEAAGDRLLELFLRSNELSKAASLLLRYSNFFTGQTLKESIETYFRLQLLQKKTDLYWKQVFRFAIEKSVITPAIDFLLSMEGCDELNLKELLKGCVKITESIFEDLLDKKAYDKIVALYILFDHYKIKIEKPFTQSKISLDGHYEDLCKAAIKGGSALLSQEWLQKLIKLNPQLDVKEICCDCTKLLAGSDIKQGIIFLASLDKRPEIFQPCLEILVDFCIDQVKRREMFSMWLPRIEWFCCLEIQDPFFTEMRISFLAELLLVAFDELNKQEDKLLMLFETLKTLNLFKIKGNSKKINLLSIKIYECYSKKENWEKMLELIHLQLDSGFFESAEKQLSCLIDRLEYRKKTYSKETLQKLLLNIESCLLIFKNKDKNYNQIIKKISQLWFDVFICFIKDEEKKGSIKEPFLFELISQFGSKIKNNKELLELFVQNISKRIIPLILEKESPTEQDTLVENFIEKLCCHGSIKSSLNYIYLQDLLKFAVKSENDYNVVWPLICRRVETFYLSIIEEKQPLKSFVEIIENFIFLLTINDSKLYHFHRSNALFLYMWGCEKKVFDEFPHNLCKIHFYLEGSLPSSLDSQFRLKIVYDVIHFLLKAKLPFAAGHALLLIYQIQKDFPPEFFEEIGACYSRILLHVAHHPDISPIWSFSREVSLPPQELSNLFLSALLAYFEHFPINAKNYEQIDNFFDTQYLLMLKILTNSEDVPEIIHTLEEDNYCITSLTREGFQMYTLEFSIAWILLGIRVFAKFWNKKISVKYIVKLNVVLLQARKLVKTISHDDSLEKYLCYKMIERIFSCFTQLISCPEKNELLSPKLTSPLSYVLLFEDVTPIYKETALICFEILDYIFENKFCSDEEYKKLYEIFGEGSIEDIKWLISKSKEKLKSRKDTKN